MEECDVFCPALDQRVLLHVLPCLIAAHAEVGRP